MRIKRILLITIALILLCVCVFGGIYFVFNLPGTVVNILTKYYEADSEKMMVYLNDRYGLIFPKSVTAVKTATTIVDPSGNSRFAMKFQINPEEINEFLANFENTIDTLPEYNLASDDRYEMNSPEWFKVPIKNGRLGYLRKPAKNIKGISFNFYLYIDLSQSDSVVVYMEGCYRHEDDRLNSKNKPE